MEVDRELRLSVDLNCRALEVARQLLSCPSPETIFDTMSKGLQELIHADIVWLQRILGPDDVQLFQSEETFRIAPLLMPDSPCRRALRQEQPFEFHGEWELEGPNRPLKLTSIICQAITHEGAQVVICAGWRHPHPITDGERQALDLFTRFSAIALKNAARYDALHAAYYGMVHGFLIALEVRDFETIAHSRRVVTYARLIAERLGISQTDLDEITLGAALHDVGKIGIPDHILKKPGKLTDDEFEVVRTHPVIGYRMLQGSLVNFPLALDVVRHHHERFDGKGYPDGLAGDEISTGARLLAVADAFDVMTTDRPYKQTKSIEEARVEIASLSGAQFCPAAAEAFLSLDTDLLKAVRHGELDNFPYLPPPVNTPREMGL